jgi:hypothetical protein
MFLNQADNLRKMANIQLQGRKLIQINGSFVYCADFELLVTFLDVNLTATTHVSD